MTISYSGKFGLLLFRWKASLWKTVWRMLAAYLVAFYVIGICYRYVMTDEQRVVFGNLAEYLETAVGHSIPIAFLLGLYVVTIVKRWWEQFENIAWPDNIMFFVSSFINDPGNEEDARMHRRTIARYSVLSAALAWRNISSRVLKRFPTPDHLVHAGLMTEAELKQYQATKAPFGRWFLPLYWIQQIIMEYRRRGLLDASQTSQILNLLLLYKNKFIRLFVFDWVSIPLVYTHVFPATPSHFFFTSTNVEVQLNKYFPLLSIMQFLFYVGWLKVAEKMMHPFGEEDDDFELNFLLDRHLYVSLMIVDTLHATPHPVLTKDIFWDLEPHMPHTKASGKIHEWKPQSKSIVSALPFREIAMATAQTSQDSETRRIAAKHALTNSV